MTAFLMFRYREVNLMSVLAPTSEILFFACPKKSIQKKRHPNAAFFLRSEAFERG
jgi:hypothetical protein